MIPPRSVSFFLNMCLRFILIGLFIGCSSAPEEVPKKKKVDPEFIAKLVAAKEQNNEILQGIVDIPTMNKARDEVLANYEKNRAVWDRFRTMTSSEKQALTDSKLGAQWTAAEQAQQQHFERLRSAFPDEGGFFVGELRQLENVGLLARPSAGKKQ